MSSSQSERLTQQIAYIRFKLSACHLQPQSKDENYCTDAEDDGEVDRHDVRAGNAVPSHAVKQTSFH